MGVGKTCSAILAAEAFLQLSPKNKVYILAPPAIQGGFYRTIFDSSRIIFGNGDQQNRHEGCTGNRYLELTQTLYERNKKDIELRVGRLINKRYAIMGYVAFRNMVRDIKAQISSTLPPKRKEEQNTVLLQRALSGCFFIVDEAHNLRDATEGDDDDEADDLGDRSDASAGKKLTPMLRDVLQKCEGNKLMLMTATPMYNSYKEIISLLNLLLYVDKIPRREAGDSDHDIRLLTDSDIVFIKKTVGGKEIDVLSPSSEKKLIAIANSHVSFMRGENPKAFPARLDPADEIRVKAWPAFSPNGSELKPDEKSNVLQLPLVNCELTGEPLEVIKAMTESLIAAKGVGIRTIDTLLQAGNCIFPTGGDGTISLEGRVGSEGFQTWFATKAVGGTFEGTRLSVLPQYVPADTDESYAWMVASDDGLAKASPKFNRVINTIRTASGISFVYSRFVENGAVIFCLLLEANGYLPWGRSAPLFSKGPIEGPAGKQCCKCDRKQGAHPAFVPGQTETRENHKFSQAFYALLTASNVDTVEKQSLPLSPNNMAVIAAARSEENKDGHKIKVVVGSQVAGEGLDLRYIREVHILEGWFHLSKEEQIVGRGIRYCSHNALPRAKRNCTINLYVNTFPAELNKETIDLYSYRTAMNKAVRVGNVSRALKRGAADCNLNRDAILVTGLSKKPALDEDGNPNMLDSQGNARPVDLNDRDFTPTCDWIACNYVCEPSLDLSDKREMPDDNGTYDMFAARFAEQMLIQTLKTAFKRQPWYHWDKLAAIFKDVPQATLTSLLLKIINNQSLVFENGNLQGHIIFRNNLFLFQPNKIQDGAIPISFRHGVYPVRRDYYEPEMVTKAQKIAVKKPLLATAAPVVIAPSEAQGAQGPQGPQGPPGPPEAPEAPGPQGSQDTQKAFTFWTKAIDWVNTWCKDDAKRDTINESISMELSSEIVAYLNETTDEKIKDNIKRGLKQYIIDEIISKELSDEILANFNGNTKEKDNIIRRLKQYKIPIELLDDIKSYLHGKTKERVKNNIERGLEQHKINGTISMKFSTAILAYLNGDTTEKDNIEQHLEKLQKNKIILMELSTTILAYLDGDTKKKENVENRMKQLQWWAKAIVEEAAAPGGMKDLLRVAKEFIWDSFFTGPEQLAMIEKDRPFASEGGNEQFIKEGSITASRYLELETREPVYFCGPGTICPPSVTKILLASKTDLVVNAKANKVTASPLYGFMVIWGNEIMFKTNAATNAEGAPPGPGAACSIVSTVKGHRMKLVELGSTLDRFTRNRFELIEETLATGARKLVGAVPFCALMEIVLRWMDIRKELYGGKRYFYRPLASYYSKHKSKK